MAKKWGELTGGEKVGGGCLGMFVVAIVLVVMTASTSPDVSNEKPSLAGISREVKSVVRSNDYLNIDVELKEAWDGNAYVFTAADTALKGLKAIKAGATDAGGPGLAGVLFTFTLPTRSKLGVEGRADLMNIQISGADVAVSVPEKMSPFDIMDIGVIELPSRAGRGAAMDYCEKSAKFSPTFCAQLAIGAL